MGLEEKRNVSLDGWEIAEVIRLMARQLGTSDKWTVGDVMRSVDRMAELRKKLS